MATVVDPSGHAMLPSTTHSTAHRGATLGLVDRISPVPRAPSGTAQRAAGDGASRGADRPSGPVCPRSRGTAPALCAGGPRVHARRRSRHGRAHHWGLTWEASTGQTSRDESLKGKSTVSKIILPGQSRSTKCPARGCKRLQAHKGSHRSTLTASTTRPSVVRPAVATEGGVEVLSFDKYEVLPEVVKAPAATKARRARRPKVVVIPMAEYTRLVAAAAKVTRRSRYIVSGKPSARLA